jgi:hypothetical protein
VIEELQELPGMKFARSGLPHGCPPRASDNVSRQPNRD